LANAAGDSPVQVVFQMAGSDLRRKAAFLKPLQEIGGV